VKQIENYNHKLVEKKWQKFWADNNTFYFNPNDKREKFYMLPMFLYPSGEMHLGHLRNFSISDVIARFKRLQGYNVLHPTGADAFGLPAENAAIKRGIHPSEWTYKNLDKIMKSMLACGLSFDTSRIFATCDPEYYGFQQKIFIDLYKNGLAFQKESYVNWDPVDQTVLANEQVINGRGWRSDAIVEKKKLKQWFLKITKYADELLDGIKNGDLKGWPEKVRLMQENWIGKSEGALVDFKIIDINPTIRLHCQNPYFDYLKKGVKTIEGRKNSPKYQKLKVGNIVEFYCDNDSFFCKITQIDKYKNLREYLENNDLSNIIPNAKSIEEAEKIYRSFSDDIDDYEFLGIHVKSIENKIQVYTTRPDTLYGASFVGISSNHPLAEKLAKNSKEIADFIEECKKAPVDEESMETMEKKGIPTGLFVEHPFDKNWKLPVWIANFILMDYGTGAIFACPAHDQRDYEFATKYNLPIKVVVSPDGKDFRLDGEAFEDEGIAINSDFLNGLPTKEAKKKAIEKIEELGVGERKINYRLRDWGISRQRYWGCPIPMVYCEHCGVVPEKEENLPVKLPEDVVFDGKGNPLANHPTWKHTTCPKCGKPAIRETDTMDTFVDSSWYFARFVDLDKKRPVNTELCNKILPIDQYVGGIEHATMHLIYSRFFTKVMADMGYFDKSIREPAKRLFNQGMVCHKAYKNSKKEWCYPWNVKEENGKYFDINTGEELTCEGIIKMSKSKCNVVDINTVIEDYGADAARLFVLSDTPADKDFEWTTEGIEGAWKYINRVWKLSATFVDENDINELKNIKITKVNELLKENHRAVKAVSNFLDNLEFNKAIARIRELSNAIEKAEIKDNEDLAIKYLAIKNLVKLLSPFTPHLCEELNQLLGEEKTLDKSNWPIFDEALTVDNEITVVIQVNGKLRGEIAVKKDLSEEEIEELARNQENVKKHLEGKEIKKTIVVPNKLINFVVS